MPCQVTGDRARVPRRRQWSQSGQTDGHEGRDDDHGIAVESSGKDHGQQDPEDESRLDDCQRRDPHQNESGHLGRAPQSEGSGDRQREGYGRTPTRIAHGATVVVASAVGGYVPGMDPGDLAAVVARPQRLSRFEDAAERPMLAWRLPADCRGISTSTIGGGIGRVRWVLNASVAEGYSRLDPEVHIRELADLAGLSGRGTGMLTAADVELVECAVVESAAASVTVGLSEPEWAVAESGRTPPAVGTINIFAAVTRPLEAGALVNAVTTATEAKVQALWEAGVEATGTATDAVVVLSPDRGPAEDFAGPRSEVGRALAEAVHEAVERGARAWLVRAAR